MSNHKNMFLFFVTICLWKSVLANSGENCDCDVIQLYDSTDLTKYHNFTKKPGDISKIPVYKSENKYLMWWSINENRWIWDFGLPEPFLSSIKVKESCWLWKKTSQHCFQPATKVHFSYHV